MKNEFGEDLDRNGYSRSVFSESCCYFAGDKYSTCGSADLVRHEVFHHDQGGATREMSKRYGAWVTLCPWHHGYVHSFPQFNRQLQRDTQKRVMARYGWTIEDFRQKFGKNYL